MTQPIENVTISELKLAAARASQVWNCGPNAAWAVLKELERFGADDDGLMLTLVNTRKTGGGYDWLSVATQIHRQAQIAA